MKVCIFHDQKMHVYLIFDDSSHCNSARFYANLLTQLELSLELIASRHSLLINFKKFSNLFYGPWNAFKVETADWSDNVDAATPLCYKQVILGNSVITMGIYLPQIEIIKKLDYSPLMISINNVFSQNERDMFSGTFFCDKMARDEIRTGKKSM